MEGIAQLRELLTGDARFEPRFGALDIHGISADSRTVAPDFLRDLRREEGRAGAARVMCDAVGLAAILDLQLAV